MTNHWTDIGNTSMVFAIGCNPSENHPACMAHINAARYDLHNSGDGTAVSFNRNDAGAPVVGAGRKAKLVVVDPRKTRTAQQADVYVRIRPGTDIAFINGVMKYIFEDFASSSPHNPTAAANFVNWHNGTTGFVVNTVGPPAYDTDTSTAARQFYADSGASISPTPLQWAAATSGGSPITGFGSNRAWPKYSDSRLVVNTSTTAADEAITLNSSAATALKHCAVSSVVVRSATAGGGALYSDSADYTLNAMAGTIARKSGSSIPDNSKVYVSYSYIADDYARQTVSVAGATMTNFPVVANDIMDANTVYRKMLEHLAPYDTPTVASICGCNPDDIATVAWALIDNSRFADSQYALTFANAANSFDVERSGYKATTLLYAMGSTQHTNGSQNIRAYAQLQVMLGNMGRPGGGINALRGIHNVQGSTDMGVLFDLIPAYSGNPGNGQSYGDYCNKLFGIRALDRYDAAFTKVTTAVKHPYSHGYGDASGSTLGMQQQGFYNMTTQWFGKTGNNGTEPVGNQDLAVTGESVTTNKTAWIRLKHGGVNSGSLTCSFGVENPGAGVVGYFVDYPTGSIRFQDSTVPSLPAKVTVDYTFKAFDVFWDLWPKGNGHDHITAFRNMKSGVVRAAVVWGQNPAITEPNQSFVRDGLENLDTLVCTDIFATETAQCKRKADGVTYLLPACSHVEEGGSVSNSGRWIQWRERCAEPKDNSKADIELMLRFAKALNGASAFSHIRKAWDDWSIAGLTGQDVWTTLYGQYGWNGTSVFEDIVGSTDYSANGGTTVTPVEISGSEAVADKVFMEMARPYAHPYGGGGTIWIYSGSGATNLQAAYQVDASGTSTPDSFADNTPTLVATAGTDFGLETWEWANRARNRNNTFIGRSRNFPRWGWAWLLNRRVQYNNGEIINDRGDNFVAAGYLARMFVLNDNTLADWTGAFSYRAYNTLNDLASTALTAGTPHKYSGRFPAHGEPTETPRVDVRDGATGMPAFGVNTSKGSNLYKADTARGTFGTPPSLYADFANPANDGFDLILTTIRCVEHFQGGPITRNNSWNVEAEPVPWIEINSIDAAKYGIADGDWVEVVTRRSNSTSGQEGRSSSDVAGFAEGFKARVGVGLQANQRVGPGLVAIPWHWGERGLSTGSRANDLCIDSYDANTLIPEFKACLCRIKKKQ